MSDLTTPHVPISKIDVDPDSNVRTHIDAGKLKGLTSTVEVLGITQPIEVRPKENGRFELIAGERRYRAAKKAGLKEVPVTFGKDDGRIYLRKLIENLQREDLDPIDTARGYLMVKGELNLKTNKQLATYTGEGEDVIGAHLRLLNLPEGVQRYVAEGVVPIEAERLLRDIAKVSPRVAECICELAKRRKCSGRYFLDHFDEIFAGVATEKFKDKPTMVPVSRPCVSDMVRGKGQRAELAERINAYVDRWRQGPDPHVPLAEADVDAARALGCLVEHTARRNGYATTTAFITDRAVAADLAHQAVERAEEAAAKRAEEAAASKGERLGDTKAQRKSDREQAKERKAAAESFNEELSGKLFKSRTASNRKRRSLARLKALALILIEDNPELAGRGLRLVLPGLQSVEVEKLKSGKERSKVTYADKEQCTTELLRRVEKAGAVEEVIEVLTESILAAILVDEHQLPRSKRIHWGLSCNDQAKVEKLLASDIKAVRPRRRRSTAK